MLCKSPCEYGWMKHHKIPKSNSERSFWFVSWNYIDVSVPSWPYLPNFVFAHILNSCWFCLLHAHIYILVYYGLYVFPYMAHGLSQKTHLDLLTSIVCCCSNYQHSNTFLAKPARSASRQTQVLSAAASVRIWDELTASTTLGWMVTTHCLTIDALWRFG